MHHQFSKVSQLHNNRYLDSTTLFDDRTCGGIHDDNYKSIALLTPTTVWPIKYKIFYGPVLLCFYSFISAILEKGFWTRKWRTAILFYSLTGPPTRFQPRAIPETKSSTIDVSFQKSNLPPFMLFSDCALNLFGCFN